MTIASAIAALSPSIWYKLDETSGTNAANSGSQDNDGTFSGSLNLTVPGPEIGTTAVRLFSGGQVVSHQMDLTTFVGQTLALWVSLDASGTINTLYPILGIGDPGNRLTRGPLIAEQHAAVGTPFWTGRFGSVGTGLNAPARDPRFWHWVAVTYASGTNGIKLYLDGTLAQQFNLTSPGTLTATDPLLVRSDQPAVVCHVCWFGGTLSQTQIQTVSAELANWPYDLPINAPPPDAGTGGGLTPPQAAQLDTIETHTSDIPGLVAAATYISDTVDTINGKVNQLLGDTADLLSNWAGYTGVTLPGLAEVLANITAAVTATIEQASGSLSVTIGQLLSSSPAQFFSSRDLSGGETCEHLDVDVSRSALYGIQLDITQWPSDWKFRTPDHSWGLKDLATINIVRGGAGIFRQGVHTRQHTLAPLPDSFPVGVGRLEAELQPQDYHIVVDFAEGVCGRLWGLVLP